MMHDAGKERVHSDVSMPAEKRGKYYETISFNEIQLPEQKDWPIGEEYDVVIRVRKTGEREPREWDEVKSNIHEYEIRKAGYEEKKKDKA